LPQGCCALAPKTSIEDCGVPGEDPLLRLYPPPIEEVPVRGLYLQRDLTFPSNRGRPWVYTNSIVSLDGRIAIDEPNRKKQVIPNAITNPRDWRLYQELGAQADALITTDRYLRELAEGAAKATVPMSSAPEYSDLRQWRKAKGLPEQSALIVLSSDALGWRVASSALGCHPTSALLRSTRR
jgi:hypothetical protein